MEEDDGERETAALYLSPPAFGLPCSTLPCLAALAFALMHNVPVRVCHVNSGASPTGTLPMLEWTRRKQLVCGVEEIMRSIDGDDEAAAAADDYALQTSILDRGAALLAAELWLDDANFARVRRDVAAALPLPARLFVQTRERANVRHWLSYMGWGARGEGEHAATAAAAADDDDDASALLRVTEARRLYCAMSARIASARNDHDKDSDDNNNDAASRRIHALIYAHVTLTLSAHVPRDRLRRLLRADFAPLTRFAAATHRRLFDAATTAAAWRVGGVDEAVNARDGRIAAWHGAAGPADDAKVSAAEATAARRAALRALASVGVVFLVFVAVARLTGGADRVVSAADTDTGATTIV